MHINRVNIIQKYLFSGNSIIINKAVSRCKRQFKHIPSKIKGNTHTQLNEGEYIYCYQDIFLYYKVCSLYQYHRMAPRLGQVVDCHSDDDALLHLLHMSESTNSSQTIQTTLHSLYINKTLYAIKSNNNTKYY